MPDVAQAVRFYEDAGLQVSAGGTLTHMRCPGQDRDAVTLVQGRHKRLHHVALRAAGLADIARRVPTYGGKVVAAPEHFSHTGLWIEDPHGMLLHLVEQPREIPLPAGNRFAINEPGNIGRINRSAIQPISQSAAGIPLRLGHVLVFTPDTMRSVEFVTQALGMGLADHAQDVIAFCCARSNSDHHVLAFARSPGIGFHHASFLVRDPDEVGRAGRRLVEKAGMGDWGFGRHTVGSNFFHYIQDPWGSWFEYYADMDFIDDYALWTPTNYTLEDSLANWGPPVPSDFVHNYEMGEMTSS
ncbi:VOC family protein [Novosphingobium lentum]|uniref:VOC family protein n=1 Tax=Novosphingobium lentum TaxID=145287 RepID=UPI00146FD35F|nr:VOC family protein [Novosphingobium lentum]